MKICSALILAVSMAGCMADDAGTLGDGDELATAEVATGQSEDALIILPPASDLAITATVSTAVERRFLWSMTVTPPTGLVYSPGQSNFERFGVQFTNTGIAASNTASGQLVVTNRSTTRSSTVAAVIAYAGEVAASVRCPPLPAVLPPSGSITCRYTASLPSTANRTLVSLAIPVGRTPAFNLAAINFSGAPTRDLDRVVEATASGHGQITVEDANFGGPVYNTGYHRQVGPFSTCGVHTSTGVASLRALTTPDSTPSGQVQITIPANTDVTVTGCP